MLFSEEKKEGLVETAETQREDQKTGRAKLGYTEETEQERVSEEERVKVC